MKEGFFMAKIKSSPQGKLLKIIGGSVFSDATTWVQELLQNAQRAQAKNVRILWDEDEAALTVSDNGKGCKNPEALLTLDYSEWESTAEGFGMGFWSVLTIPTLNKITVHSEDWIADIQVSDILGGNMDVNVENSPIRMNGFSVKLKAETFDIEAVLKAFEEHSKYLPFGVTVETKTSKMVLPKADFLKDYAPWNAYGVQRINTPLFEGVLGISRYSWAEITVFYDGRLVRNINPVPYLTGVISVKSGKVTLKEPDRKEFIRNSRFDGLIKELEKTVKRLLQDYIRESGTDGIEEAVARWLKVSEYENCLTVNPNWFDDEESAVSADAPDMEETPVDASENSVTNSSDVPAEKPVAAFHPEQFEAEDRDIVQKPQKQRTSRKTAANQMETGFKKLKKKKNLVYVPAEDAEAYAEVKATAEYAGLKVLVAPNSLYEKAFLAYGIPHIDAVVDGLQETHSFRNEKLKNKSEELFVQSLGLIMQKYQLPSDTFRIADISKEVCFFVDGKKRFIKKFKNNNEKINIYGCTDGFCIFLDRKLLNLSAKSLHHAYDMNAVKTVLRVSNTIAHELAHYRYGTIDNTVRHYEAITQLQDEIIAMYLQCI
jgi:hypothetical protein